MIHSQEEVLGVDRFNVARNAAVQTYAKKTSLDWRQNQNFVGPQSHR